MWFTFYGNVSSTQFAKNSPPDCILNAHLRVLLQYLEKTKNRPIWSVLNFGRGRRTRTLGTRFWRLWKQFQNRYLIRFSAPAFKFDTNSDTKLISLIPIIAWKNCHVRVCFLVSECYEISKIPKSKSEIHSRLNILYILLFE